MTKRPPTTTRKGRQRQVAAPLRQSPLSSAKPRPSPKTTAKAKPLPKTTAKAKPLPKTTAKAKPSPKTTAKAKPSPKTTAKAKPSPKTRTTRPKTKGTAAVPGTAWENSADSLEAAIDNLRAAHETTFLCEQLLEPMRAACVRAAAAGEFDVTAFRAEATPIVVRLVAQGELPPLTAYDIKEMLGAFRVVRSGSALYMRMLPLAGQILRECAAPESPTPDDGLKNRIRAAFGHVPRREWILDDVFRDAPPLDGQDETLAAFADKTWQTVEPEVLDKESIDLLGPAAFHYYTPAFALRVLQRWGTYSSNQTCLALAMLRHEYDDERNMERLVLYSDQQVEAVIAFLERARAQPGFDEEWRHRMQTSISEFWTSATRRLARRRFALPGLHQPPRR